MECSKFYTKNLHYSGKNRELWLSEGIFIGFIHKHIRICQDLFLDTPSFVIFIYPAYYFKSFTEILQFY